MLGRIVVQYDIQTYPFAQIMRDHLAVPDLAKLHNYHSLPPLFHGNDQRTDLHRLMYEVWPSFFHIYHRFILEQVTGLIGESIVFQKLPNFRAQLPGNVAVGKFHRDRDNHHSCTEINFWVPLTQTTHHNTIWIESTQGRRDFRPVIINYGQMLIFDGANLEHGNRINNSDQTRVSFDFRVIPAHVYEDNPKRTVVMEMPLVLGEYWQHLPQST